MLKEKIRVFGMFVVFLLLFQPLEAKKRKQSTSLASKIENSIVTFMDLIYEAWDGIVYFLPDIHASSGSTKKSKKKKNSDPWGINYYVKSATNNLNFVYETVSDSLQVVEQESKAVEPEHPAESVFTIELLVAEIFDGITRGVVRVISGFDQK